ncbi:MULTISPECIES: DUF4410 domain-containing protein [Burkholderia]|uniref:DUF4410 domain-containing protein n=1 Tax=Burkholderia TaxID=32008 RepID=UPI0005024E6E|nr:MULTISPECIES: DUF4410 domain-containing protein [Burkholderia]EKS9889360.1 DUF4410 domain-containing protein [Burkholderia pyrrocinia]EKS9897762.1 DUF4410 domain-containing protein [Burkholderia pyrrocinia]EKS9910813.1 DUF4410 domain-containing protein [Burkholderia pyrrocinia]KFL52273.1 hypothetical protein JM78_17150 [Burkholderia pyrrocinia]TDA47605.1 DUF4410 domain-containing protein [Burkholderia pyrrocinia]
MKSVIRHATLALVTIGFLSGCASSVTRDAGNQAGATATASTSKFGTKPVIVQVTLDAAAQEALKDNLKFSPKKLQEQIESALDARKLLAKADSTDAMHLNVEVTGIRVRSSFSAVMFGFMAGSDYVDGTVTLVGTDNRQVDRFKVSASYALGGIAGMDGTRMDWLYENFTEKTLSTLDPSAGAQQADAAHAKKL